MSFNDSPPSFQLHAPSLIVCLHRESESATQQEIEVVGPVVTLLQQGGRCYLPRVAE